MATRKKKAGSSPRGGGAEGTPAGGPVRLNKLLAENGIASRRAADKLITEGEVMVDGQIVTELGLKVDPDVQRVEVDGVVLRSGGERHRYYLLNKPAGVVCTNDVREHRPRAIDLITDRKKGRIYPVGRLDEETVGLLLLTNDGEFANRIAHPRYGVSRTYRVTVDGRVRDADVERMKEGVRLSDFVARFERARVLKRSETQASLLVTLQEGKNREIRRVFAKLGLKVRKLRRVAIGRLGDRGLKIGHWRMLTPAEVAGLLELSGGEPQEADGGRGARSRSAKGSGSPDRSGAGRSGAGRSGSGRHGSGRTGSGRSGSGSKGSGRSSSARSGSKGGGRRGPSR